MSDRTLNEVMSLPWGWENPTLAEITQINPALDRCVINDSIEVNFVPMRAVAPEGGGVVDPEVRTYGEVKKGYTAFLSGDVIMAKITPCMENGKTTVVPELPDSVCFGSTEFHVLRCEGGVLARWIAYFMQQHDVRRVAQRSMTGGVGQMRVPATFLEALRVPLAPTDEQRRITDTLDELLSDLDAGVALLEGVQEKLEHYRASVLKAAVEGSLTSEWRRQHPDTEPASEMLKRILAERRRRWEEEQLRKFDEAGKQPPKNWQMKYKEPVEPDVSSVPQLPESWCWASFDQIGETQGGLQKSPSRKPVLNHYPYLRVANVHRGSLDLRELQRFELTEDELRKLRLQRGDLLIVEGNGSRTEIGRCTMWLGEIDDCVHQNHIIRVRPLNGVLPDYANLFLNSPWGQKAIQKAASSTSGLYTLSIAKIERLNIPLPSLREQEMIVEQVEDQLSIINYIETDIGNRLKAAQGLRQSILRHAFTGQLVPQVPNDEPASELLKRIAAEREERRRQVTDTKRTVAKQRQTRKRAGVAT